MKSCNLLVYAPNSLSTSIPLFSPLKFSAHFTNSHCFNHSLKFTPRRLSSLSSTATQEIVEVRDGQLQYIEIGYISSVHGLQGEVRVKPNTDFPELRFSEPGRRWLKQQILGRETVQEVELVEGRGHHGQKSWIVKFNNIDKMEQAQQLVGSTILITDEDRPELEEGEFYAHDLVGMRVILKETGEPVGSVVNVFDNGGNDLLHVKLDSSLDITDKNGKLKSEAPLVWIPFVEAIVPDVDMNKREMLITPPKGLLELNIRTDERSKKERRQLEWKERKKFQKRLIAAKKKLCEMEQKHVFDGFRHGEKAQGNFLANQIVGVNSQLLQVALQTIENPLDRWNLSELLATCNEKVLYKISKDYASPEIMEKHRTLTSKGKVATVLFIDGKKMQQFSNDILLQRLLKIEDPQATPLIFVCPANAIDTFQNFISNNDHFGFDPKKVWFLEEEKLPVVSSSLEENRRHKILMKSPWEMLQTPVGSGGIVSLLSSHNILESLGKMGVEYIEVCSVDERYVGGDIVLGLMDSNEAYIGIQMLNNIKDVDEDFYIVFSIKFMKQLSKKVNELFHVIQKPNQHVEMVDKDWVEVIPSSPNSFEFRSSIYACLKACPLDKVCIMEVIID